MKTETASAPSVPLHEVAAHFTAPVELVAEWARAQKVPIGTDWQGAPALTLEQATEFVRSRRALLDEHNAKWASYVDHRETRKREAADARAKELAEAQKRQRERLKASKEKWTEENDRRAAAETALAAEEREKLVGLPVPFEKFTG